MPNTNTSDINEILYNLIMLNKVRESDEVETDEQFLKAKAKLQALIEKRELEARIDSNGVFAYHGTNEAGAREILKHGFKPNTHFAHHLEECLEFGGSWVFRVEWENKPLNWQFLNEETIPPERIDRLTQYRPIVRVGTQHHMTRKLDNEQESKNLTGIPLKALKEKK